MIEHRCNSSWMLLFCDLAAIMWAILFLYVILANLALNIEYINTPLIVADPLNNVSLTQYAHNPHQYVFTQILSTILGLVVLAASLIFYRDVLRPKPLQGSKWSMKKNRSKLVFCDCSAVVWFILGIIFIQLLSVAIEPPFLVVGTDHPNFGTIQQDYEINPKPYNLVFQFKILLNAINFIWPLIFYLAIYRRLIWKGVV